MFCLFVVNNFVINFVSNILLNDDIVLSVSSEVNMLL